MSAFEALMAHERTTCALEEVAGILSWDREVMMPAGAAEARAGQSAALAGVIHARRTDPRVAGWLAAVDEAVLDGDGRAQLREIRRRHARACRVPGRLVEALAAATSRAQGIWAEARAREDVPAFLPALAEVVTLRREEGAALAEGDGADAAYDALVDAYEPGAKAADMAALFADLRPGLVALRERALAAPAAPVLSGRFPAAGQMALAREIAGCFGYDFTRGRLDLSVHPFTGGGGHDDVRITTRVDEADPFNCLYSTIHELGHALYEQAIDPALAGTPIGTGVSMGVHESQSRLLENQIGRGPGFATWLFGRMRARFGEIGITTPEAFHAALNRVHAGFIRTEADEVHYNLHVLLRFDLERALIGGGLAVADLEEAWNTRFAADFGVEVPRPSLGMLQDVHWSAGLFGYFPTYTLGNVYAGCLWAAMRRDLPGLDDDLAQGEPGAAMAWLRARLQHDGARRPPRETIRRACGAEPGAAPLLGYLETKFGAPCAARDPGR